MERGRRRGYRALADELRRPGRHLLVFDPAGDGRAAVAVGDVDTARHVAVLVPGMSVEVDDADRLVRGARVLAAVAPGTAVVAWLGYDTPRPVEVISDRRARGGARQLTEFVHGVRAVADRRQQMTVIGHSYGSLLAGLAARGGLGADDLVLVGSPSVEAGSAAELGMPRDHVWAVRAEDDPVRLVFGGADRAARLLGLADGRHLVTWYGPDPSRPEFGARHFGSAPGCTGTAGTSARTATRSSTSGASRAGATGT